MFGRKWRKICSLGVLATQLSLAAAAPALGEGGAWEGMPAVADRELAGMRGGYLDREGVRIHFGIEQAVFVDGLLQAVTRLNAEDGLGGLATSPLTGDSEWLTDAGMQLFRLGQSVKMGSGDLAPTRFLTVVQNSQDQRVIDTLTRIDAVVHGLSALRDNRALHTLQNQIIDSLR